MKEENLKTINCLDKGFIRLVDYMGDDSAIVQAARVSYGEGTKTFSEDRSLIRYLMNKKHTSPFEQVEFKFHVKAPIVVFRQWHRHRTSSINELSGRYSEMKDECYMPNINDLNFQNENNKQCRDENKLDDEVSKKVLIEMEEVQTLLFRHYRNLLDLGLAREICRINLPLSTYSEMYWKMDLHNLFHFLKLRLDKHAQKEIRVYAEAICELIKPVVPIAYEAFSDYLLNSISLSKDEKNILNNVLCKLELSEKIKETILSSISISKREKKELIEKLGL